MKQPVNNEIELISKDKSSSEKVLSHKISPLPNKKLSTLRHKAALLQGEEQTAPSHGKPRTSKKVC